MVTAKQSSLDNLPFSKEESPETYRLAGESFDRKWSPWCFNQAIGWLRLYVFGKSIKAEYYFIDAKRISKFVKNKRFLYRGKAFELNPSNSESSTDIYKSIRDKIIRLNSEKPFEGRYIDLEKFDNIGPHVNWRTIFDFE